MNVNWFRDFFSPQKSSQAQTSACDRQVLCHWAFCNPGHWWLFTISSLEVHISQVYHSFCHELNARRARARSIPWFHINLLTNLTERKLHGRLFSTLTERDFCILITKSDNSCCPPAMEEPDNTKLWRPSQEDCQVWTRERNCLRHRSNLTHASYLWEVQCSWARSRAPNPRKDHSPLDFPDGLKCSKLNNHRANGTTHL